MKKVLIYILISVFLFAGTGIAQTSGKIGHVDLSSVFDEYQKTKDFDKDLEKKGDAKQGQREKLVSEIRKMRDEVEMMNEKSRDKKEQDIEAKIRALQEFDQDAKNALTKERDDMVRDILREINDVIRVYGENNGYSVILNDRVLLYGDQLENLTDDIIKILNDNYKR